MKSVTAILIKTNSNRRIHTQFDKDNSNYIHGNSIRVKKICSFCGKEITGLLCNKRAFCNRIHKDLWQKENLCGKNNPTYGLKRPDLVKYNKTRVFSEETKEKIRQKTIIQLHNNIINRKDTLPEKMVESILRQRNIEYIKQYKFKLGIADFYLPKTNTIVEVFGDYWHNLPKRKIKDLKKFEYLISKNYNIQVLWEHDIYKDINGCMEFVV